MDTANTNQDAATFLTLVEEFSAVVNQVEDWTAPTPCADWQAADLLTHVIDTQRDFFAERDMPLAPVASAEPAAAWDDHAGQVRTLLSDDDVAGRAYEGYIGPTTIAVALLDVYGFDLVVHRWDLGRSSDQLVRFSAAEMDAVEASIATFGDMLYSEGICRRPVDIGTDASRQDRILAHLGRPA